MGWFDDVVGAVKGVSNFFNENKVLGSVLSTVITGYGLYKVQDSIESSANTNTSGTTGTGGAPRPAPTDFGTLIQVPPNQDNKIPVFYGNAVISGIITEAVMSNNRATMTYVMTICEKTGQVNLGAGAQSVITFQKIYWNDQEVTFHTDGVTAAYLTNSVGDVDRNVDGLVKIWCYNNGSSSSTSPAGYSAGTHWAFNNVPNWDSTYTMDGLVFAVIQINYKKENKIVGMPTMKFLMKNTMEQPGDVIYDYMTNTRYGAGIAPGDITL